MSDQMRDVTRQENGANGIELLNADSGDFAVHCDMGDLDGSDAGPQEEVEFVCNGANVDEATNRFDRVVGALEEALLDEAVFQAQEDFSRQHCGLFEEGEENRLEYMDVYAQWNALLERILEERLQGTGVTMQEVMAAISERGEGELGAEVFDLLLSMADFEAFKALMLDYKEQAKWEGMGPSVAGMRVHEQEQEDGDARPDLDLLLGITPL
ncbi:unnamed protein product [Pedinophyceae sp. YPF-701]|nr:unnamed protein product [Pedinophyceae sp. YPF-701]